VLAFLRETHGAHDLDSFAQIVPSALTRLITADVATYSEVNPLRKRVGWHYQPGTIPLFDFRSAFERFMHTDPLVLHYASGADGQATKISDLMTQRQFRSLPIYSEFYRHLGLQHQIAFLLDTVKPLLVGMTLNRSSKDFLEEDRSTLNALRPHLIQAYRNGDVITRSRREIALMSRGLENSSRAIVLLTHERLVVRATDRARHWLVSYFGWRPRTSSRLPEALDRWLCEELRRRSDPTLVAAPLQPFCIETIDGSLVARLVIQDEGVIVLLDERLNAAAENVVLQHGLRSSGLSKRESEVLSWVVRGKTNPEIAIILSMSSRTVQTHLDHIYRKLDVQTRAGAAAKAMEVTARVQQ